MRSTKLLRVAQAVGLSCSSRAMSSVRHGASHQNGSLLRVPSNWPRASRSYSTSLVSVVASISLAGSRPLLHAPRAHFACGRHECQCKNGADKPNHPPPPPRSQQKKAPAVKGSAAKAAADKMGVPVTVLQVVTQAAATPAAARAQETENAFQQLCSAADKEKEPGLALLYKAICLARGLGCTANMAAAVELLGTLAVLDSARAQREMVEYRGAGGLTEQAREENAEALRKSGHEHVACSLEPVLMADDDEQLQLAMPLLEAAAKAGVAGAQLYLALALLGGRGGHARDPKRGFESMEAAAKSGSFQAQFLMSRLH